MIGNQLQKLRGRTDLSNQEMLDVMDLIMSGRLQDSEIEEFLIAMNEKGASINEISSAASVMRDKSLNLILEMVLISIHVGQEELDSIFLTAQQHRRLLLLLVGQRLQNMAIKVFQVKLAVPTFF